MAAYAIATAAVMAMGATQQVLTDSPCIKVLKRVDIFKRFSKQTHKWLRRRCKGQGMILELISEWQLYPEQAGHGLASSGNSEPAAGFIQGRICCSWAESALPLLTALPACSFDTLSSLLMCPNSAVYPGCTGAAAAPVPSPKLTLSAPLLLPIIRLLCLFRFSLEPHCLDLDS